MAFIAKLFRLWIFSATFISFGKSLPSKHLHHHNNNLQASTLTRKSLHVDPLEIESADGNFLGKSSIHQMMLEHQILTTGRLKRSPRRDNARASKNQQKRFQRSPNVLSIVEHRKRRHRRNIVKKHLVEKRESKQGLADLKKWCDILSKDNSTFDYQLNDISVESRRLEENLSLDFEVKHSMFEVTDNTITANIKYKVLFKIGLEAITKISRRNLVVIKVSTNNGILTKPSSTIDDRGLMTSLVCPTKNPSTIFAVLKPNQMSQVQIQTAFNYQVLNNGMENSDAEISLSCLVYDASGHKENIIVEPQEPTTIGHRTINLSVINECLLNVGQGDEGMKLNLSLKQLVQSIWPPSAIVNVVDTIETCTLQFKHRIQVNWEEDEVTESISDCEIEYQLATFYPKFHQKLPPKSNPVCLHGDLDRYQIAVSQMPSSWLKSTITLTKNRNNFNSTKLQNPGKDNDILAHQNPELETRESYYRARRRKKRRHAILKSSLNLCDEKSIEKMFLLDLGGGDGVRLERRVEIDSSGKDVCNVIVHLPFGYYGIFNISTQKTSGPILKSEIDDTYAQTVNDDNDCKIGVFLQRHLVATLSDISPNRRESSMCSQDLSMDQVRVSSNKIQLSFYPPLPTDDQVVVFELRAYPVKELEGDCQDLNSESDNNLPNDRWLKSGRNKCVKLMRQNLAKWNEADMICRNQEMAKLVTIQNQEEQKAMEEIILNSPDWRLDLGIWIGARKFGEKDGFSWTGGAELNYTNWFPGWNAESQEPSRGPDEGCVEIKAAFPGIQVKSLGDINKVSSANPMAMAELFSEVSSANPAAELEKFFWNDANCNKLNWFLCEKEARQEDLSNIECKQTVHLDANQSSAFLESPNFPESHPPNINCTYLIQAPLNYIITIQFIELNLPQNLNGNDCGLAKSYLTIENLSKESSPVNQRSYCGTGNPIKSLNFKSTTNQIQVKFVSGSPPQNVTRSGFRLKVVALILSEEFVELFLKSGVISSKDYPSAYPPNLRQSFKITSQQPQSRIILNFQTVAIEESMNCEADSLVIDDGINPQKLCSNLKPADGKKIVYQYESQSNSVWVNFTSDSSVEHSGFTGTWEMLETLNCTNSSVREQHGRISSPGYPNEFRTRYSNPLDCWTTIQAPVDHRVVLSIEVADFDQMPRHINNNTLTQKLDWPDRHGLSQECQMEKSFYVEIFVSEFESLKLCVKSNATKEKRSLKVVTTSNSTRWISTRKAQEGKKIMLQETHKVSIIGENDVIKSEMQVPKMKKTRKRGSGNYPFELVSSGNQLKVRFYSLDGKILGKGFSARYKIENFQLNHIGPEMRLNHRLNPMFLTNVNYPLSAPLNLRHLSVIRAQPGANIQVSLLGNKDNQNCSSNYIQFEDPYRKPAKFWRFCHFHQQQKSTENEEQSVGIVLQSYLNILKVTQVTDESPTNFQRLKFKLKIASVQDQDLALKVQQMTSADNNSYMNEMSKSSERNHDTSNSSETEHEEGFGQHSEHSNENSASQIVPCGQNSCFNGGWCDPDALQCKCKGHFTGPQCLQTICDINPCANGGICRLTAHGHSCTCTHGFGGIQCHQRVDPCDLNPCGRNGICIRQRNTTSGYKCQCHLWWIGPRCNNRLKNIPFKPLSERMLEEPFWLGLMAVCVVLCILGIGYYFKKHVPDKFDKFLSYGGGDNTEPIVEKPPSGRCSTFSQYNTQMSTGSDNTELMVAAGGSGGGELRAPSIGSIGATNSQMSFFESSPNSSKRSLLGKLSIRKTSVLSTSSNASSPGYGEKKNFSSIEDMFKRSPSASPLKKFPSPNRRDEEERRQILKMLVTPQGSASSSASAAKRTLSSASFDNMVIKAARSAENLQQATAGVACTASASSDSNTRKISSSSLQIPGGLLRRSNSDNTGTSSASHCCHQDDPSGAKKVTFSQVVDQMACSLSDSSSLSDLSSCAEDFKRNVSSSSGHTAANSHGGGRSGRQGRKLFRSKRKQAMIAGGVNNLQLSANYFQYQYKRRHPSNGTSGSEDRCGDESSMESIESSSHNLSLSPLSALNLPADSAKYFSAKKLQKISSADSLFTMIKNLASNRLNTSTPSSPQMSEAGDYLSSSGIPTPLTTPDTPNAKPAGAFAPRAKEYFLRKPTSNNNSASTSPVSSPSPTRTQSGSQIMVEVLDPLNPRRSDKQSGSLSSSGSGMGQSTNNPTITLEVPTFHYGGKCLSPIKELPSPMPTPSPSPLPFRQSMIAASGSQSRANSVEEDISSSSSSGRSSSTPTNSSNSRRNSLRQLFRHRDAVDEESDDIHMSMQRGYNEIFIPVPNIRRDSVCRSSFASDFDPFDETSFILSRQNSDAFFDSISPFASPIPLITLTCYETESCEDELSEKSGDEKLIVDDNVKKDSRTNEDNLLSCFTDIVIDVTPPSPPADPNEAAPMICRDIPQVFVSFDEEDTQPGESNSGTSEIVSDPSPESQEYCQNDESKSITKTKRRPPPLQISNSNFCDLSYDEDTMSERKETPAEQKPSNESPKHTSPTGRKCLVKQSVVCEDSMHFQPPNDSPKFLIPPGKFDSTPRSRSQSVELRQDFADQQHSLAVIEAKRNYDRTHRQNVAGGESSGSTIVSVLSVTGRRPSSDGLFGKRDYAKPASVNLIVQPPTPSSSTEGLSNANYDFQFYSGIHKRRDSREETLATIMRQRSSGEQVSSSTAAAVASWSGIRLGSPPAKRNSFSFGVNQQQQTKHMAFELYSAAPAITITPMCDTGESETDSPVTRMSVTTGGMHYLSPYTVVTSSRTTSESNLSSSSSGYSSMASPGPSRSGSSNPLSCLSESEDNTSGTPTKTNALFFARQHHGLGVGSGQLRLEACGPVFMRRPGSLLKSPSVDSESSDPSQQQAHNNKPYAPGTERRQLMAARYRTDSETTDDQCIPESASEPHDSALDSMDDYIEEEMVKNVDNDDKAKTKLENKIEDSRPQQVPQICLLEVQSSTESDKTVLSTTTVFEQQLRALNSDCSLPSSPGLICATSATGYESDTLCEGRFNRMMLALPEIIVLPCTPLPSSVESSPISSSSSSSSLSLVHQSSSEHPTAGTSSSFSSSSFKGRRQLIRGGGSAPASLHTNPSTSVEYEQISSSSGCGGGGGGFGGATSLSSSRSESPASDRFGGKCSSLVSLHLRNIESELDYLGSATSLNTKVQDVSVTSDEKRKRTRKMKKDSLESTKTWKGSTSSVAPPRISRLRRRRISPDQLTLENSALLDGKPKSLSPIRLRSSSKGDPNTSSSNESVYSNNSNFSRQNLRRQCLTEQSSTDESDCRVPTSPTIPPQPAKLSSTTSSSASKTGSPSVSLTTLTSQPLSHTTRPQRIRQRRKRMKQPQQDSETSSAHRTTHQSTSKLSPTTRAPAQLSASAAVERIHTSLESSDSLTAAEIPTNNISTDENALM